MTNSSLILKVIISYNPYALSSASANRWRTLLDGLTKYGVSIELLIFSCYQTEDEKRKFHQKGTMENINYQYLNPVIYNSYFGKRFYNYFGHYFSEPKIKNRIFQLVKNSNALIWTDSSHFSFQMAVKIKSKQPKNLLFLEMNEFLDIHKYNKGNSLQRWKADRMQKFFESKAFYKYDGIALMTKTLLKHFSSRLIPHLKLLHLPMTVDLERFSAVEEVLKGFRKPYIAFVGIMSDAKDGLNILIEAFSKIASQFPTYNLYLVGPWQYDTPSHLKMIKENNLSNRIFWMKEYPRDKIPAILKNASLLVLPRPDSKQAQGGFPTKLGEYLATGNPVCATTVGEIPDYLVGDESVYFADPGSVDSFADAIRRALSNPKEAMRIGTSGCKVAEKYFNKDIQAKKLYDFLLSLTKNSSAQEKI
jgi:glycosyltransferase involved in cell wall biosynthesis